MFIQGRTLIRFFKIYPQDAKTGRALETLKYYSKSEIISHNGVAANAVAVYPADAFFFFC